MENRENTMEFGELLKNIRLRKRITLREFCRRSGSDPGNISRLERGLMRPPQDRDILLRYAAALDIKEGDDDWYRLSDKAAAECGKIPSDLMDNPMVKEALPAFFRTVRGQKPTEEDMRKLLAKLAVETGDGK
ncbi:MAG: helix-turn-helix transcriptional regulator [Lentisphaeria bacterium]|nr:helix-turn-helix transcriptional regulator [Lentisphaeria bacterium]